MNHKEFEHLKNRQLPERERIRYYIGIDTGDNTGYAVWDALEQRLVAVETLMIHQAIIRVLEHSEQHEYKIHVIVEDARKRKIYKAESKHYLQGVGSVKRDANIWEDFLKDYNISYEMRTPRNTKMFDAAQFNEQFNWKGRTSEHSRDAALMIVNLK